MIGFSNAIADLCIFLFFFPSVVNIITLAIKLVETISYKYLGKTLVFLNKNLTRWILS
jgi:hypothetical protein